MRPESPSLPCGLLPDDRLIAIVTAAWQVRGAVDAAMNPPPPPGAVADLRPPIRMYQVVDALTEEITIVHSVRGCGAILHAPTRPHTPSE